MCYFERANISASPKFGSCGKPRNRPAADIVGARDLAERFLFGVDAFARFALLMGREGRLSTELDAVCHGASAAFARAGADQVALNSAKPAEHGQHQAA